MGLVARGPEESTHQQALGRLLATLPEHATGEVHHDSVADDGSVVHHTQRFERGELVEWRLTDEPGPWALVRPGSPEDPCPTGVARPEEVAAVSVRVGSDPFVLPPLDDLPDPAMQLLDWVPDATARLRFELWGSPVGAIVCDVRYQDGRRPIAEVVGGWDPTEPGEAAHDAPEMSVAMTYRNYLRMRAGELTALEAIADGGDVRDTNWTLLLLLHGLIQSDPYVAAYRAMPRFPEPLGWWGEAAPHVPDDARPTA